MLAGNAPWIPDRFAVGGLIAERLRDEHRADMLRMDQDAEVMATLGGVRDRAATDAYMAANLEHWDRYGFGIYRLGDRRDRSLAGRAGLRHVTIAGRDEIEVAYALLTPYWGRALACTIAVKLVAIAHENRLCSSVIGFTLRSNHRSRRVMEKAGFVYERDLDHARAPHVLYRQHTGAPARPASSSAASARRAR